MLFGKLAASNEDPVESSTVWMSSTYLCNIQHMEVLYNFPQLLFCLSYFIYQLIYKSIEKCFYSDSLVENVCGRISITCMTMNESQV